MPVEKGFRQDKSLLPLQVYKLLSTSVIGGGIFKST